MSTNSINSTKRKFLTKNYGSLDGHIRKWYEENVKEGRLCLAISRKAPRLMEWVEKRLGKQRVSNVITENAVPFVDWSKVTDCVVTDEAIYNGTTFANVYAAVSGLRPSEGFKIHVNPLVVTDEAMDYVRICSIIPQSTLRIKPSDVPFFIDTVTSRFLQLGKPYDVEYPIIYIDFKDDISPSDLETIAEELSKKESRRTGRESLNANCYTTETYSRELRKCYSNVTYLTDYLFEDEVGSAKPCKPDFSKVRLYADGKRMCIVPMSPYTINFRDICKDSPMFRGELRDVWNRIYECAKKLDSSSEEYGRQWKKSLVTMANYLLSFNMFLLLKDSLTEVVKSKGAGDMRFETMDLTYLLGKDLANEICGKLSFSMKYAEPKLTTLPFGKLSVYIPPTYVKEYYSTMGADVRRGLKSISDLVSGMYSSMHWNVELKSRKKMGTRFDRLRFGESYASMMERYRLVSVYERSKEGRELLWNDVNRNIDSRIDRGSVVPTYFMEESPSMEYWTRMFRSGENEDLFKDQFLRLMSHIYVNYCKEADETFIRRKELELILTLMSIDDNDNGNRFFACPVTTEKGPAAYYNMCSNQGLKRTIIEIAKCLGLLDEDNMQFLSSNLKLIDRYADGTPLSSEDEKELGSILKAVAAYSKNVEHDNFAITNLMNSLMYNEDGTAAAIEGLRQMLKAWIAGKNNLSGLKNSVSEFTKRFASLIDFLPLGDEREVEADNNEWVKRIYDIEAGAFKSVKAAGMRETIERMFIIFTLWAWYEYGEKSRRLNENALPNLHVVFEAGGKTFSDGTTEGEWFKTVGSFNNIKNLDAADVKAHLLQALGA